VVADGRVFIPEEASWLESFLFEVAAFPNIADKDQADSMSQLLAYHKRAVYMAGSELRRR
jgi:phage terminase large subunit-like protein